MKTIAVIFGGRSTEHDISIITALAAVIKPLEMSGRYHVEPVYIAKDGSWYWDQKLKDIQLYQSGEIDDWMKKAPKVHLLFDHGLTLVKSSQFAGRKTYKKIDVVFPAMHGTHGEDGQLMGLLDMAGVAYVGCDMPASVLAMDKVLAKQIVTQEGLSTNKWVWFYSRQLATDHKAVMNLIKPLQYPLFVKPAHLGSSIGISRVVNDNELVNALEVATHYDDKVIVEEAVPNLIEVTLPILGNDELRPALLEQPRVKDGALFDFDTKYMNQGKGGGKKMGGGKQGAQGYSQIPADLPKELYAKAEKLGLDVYRALNCKGTARVDMLIDSKKGAVYFNEVNPLPGSLYAHNWRLAGVSSVQLVEKLVDLAEDNFVAKQKLETTFSTSFLKQF